MTARVDTVEFFDHLADVMNADPGRFSQLGPADMVVGIVMRRPKDAFRLHLVFEGVGCAGVHELAADEAPTVDFSLVGELREWQAMFEDIVEHGRATGEWTINSLALMGSRIACAGPDPMGLDKFSRFNQTLQEFFDGAARMGVPASSGGR